MAALGRLVAAARWWVIGAWIVLAAAGLVAGAIGAAGGITSLVSYSALLAVGIPPLPATVTNLVAGQRCQPADPGPIRGGGGHRAGAGGRRPGAFAGRTAGNRGSAEGSARGPDRFVRRRSRAAVSERQDGGAKW